MKHLPLIALTALLTACGGGSDDDTQQNAEMSLAFSDAPVDSVSKVCIAVSNISIHPVSGSEQAWTTASFLTSAQDDGCTPAGELIPLDSAGHPLFTYIDLLKYPGSASRPLLASQSVVPGEYSQMRLRVEGRQTAEEVQPGNVRKGAFRPEKGHALRPLEIPGGGKNLPVNGL